MFDNNYLAIGYGDYVRVFDVKRSFKTYKDLKHADN